jgi:hypothetical protein
VTTWVCGVAVRMTRFVVTTRRMRLTGRLAAWRLRTTGFRVQGEQGFAFCTCAAAGTSLICIAPVPMIAPPQVQAQSLARAIRTDIGFSLFSRCWWEGATPRHPLAPLAMAKRPKLCERRNCVNRVCLSDSGKRRGESTPVGTTVPKRNGNGSDSLPLVNPGAQKASSRPPRERRRITPPRPAVQPRFTRRTLSAASALVSHPTAGYRRAHSPGPPRPAVRETKGR